MPRRTPAIASGLPTDRTATIIARNTITNAGHGTIFIGGDKAGMAPVEDNVVVSNDLANPWAANCRTDRLCQKDYSGMQQDSRLEHQRHQLRAAGTPDHR